MRTSGCIFLKRCILAAAAIGLALAGSAGAETAKCKLGRIAEWPLRAGGRPVIDGEINGQKIGILLDTGAGMSLFLRSAATKMGLTRYEAPGYRAFAIGGETRAETVLIDEFRIGQSVRKNWRVLVAGEQSFSDDIAFLLGDDYFEQAEVEFDLAHNAVRLYQTEDCQGVSLAYWATEPAGEAPIEAGSKIWLTVVINDKRVRAQLDSGAGNSLLSKADAARLGVTPESPGTVAAGCVRGLGERQADSWIGQFESFAIGNERIKNPRIHFADLWQHTTYVETGSRLPNRMASGLEKRMPTRLAAWLAPLNLPKRSIRLT